MDEELAAGRISADDYRLRRDGVLSAAVNADPQPSQTGTGDAESTHIIAPVTPPPGQPQPPAPSGDQTQIVNTSFGDGERTQAVSQGPAPQGWAPAGQGDADRTQVVPGVPPQATAGGYQGGHGSGGFPAQQPPPQYAPPPSMSGPNQQLPWAAPAQNTSTPWGGSDFPADTSWVGQGPEPSFETTPAKGSKKIIAIIVAVVVLAGLGVGGYFLFSGGNQPTPPVAQSSTAPPPPTQKPKDDLEIAKLPGDIKETTDFAKFDDFEARKVLTDEENAAVASADPTTARMSVSNLPSGVTVVVVTVKTSGASAAANTVEKLGELQAKYKLGKYTGTTPPGVDIMQLVKEDGSALIRAHYVHKQTVVRVQVNGADMSGVSRAFDEILAKQLAELPANS
ncbi:hypothetical protein SAMN04489730_1118 [Amycolatopsis australiensis]|uniref:Flagellar basal body-associated protein FliL n=1 Tax=Amycolatopsis australiensis TaxID=546364 RepID=A0A1K1PWN4_9PSEU|nr:hypothetical protein SAMN04489730_1118 [Amycolatopsis australiensis]